MCRLFGLTAGDHAVNATFWLLEAPDSLAEQSRRNPDGYGLAIFDDQGRPHVDKRPVPAFEDQLFATDAREERSPVFLAHVRYASEGRDEMVNTHPFERDGRVFAHNGHIEDLDKLEAELGDDMRHVEGDTDSERFFALVTREIDRHGGDPAAGLAAAANWAAEHLALYALNCLLATAEGLWALRYPETHPLLVLQRASGGESGMRHFDAASAAGRIRVRSGALAECPSVVLATEPMDEDPGWRAMEPGELVHVGRDLRVSARMAVERPPARQLALTDLAPRVAAAQG